MLIGSIARDMGWLCAFTVLLSSCPTTANVSVRSKPGLNVHPQKQHGFTKA